MALSDLSHCVPFVFLLYTHVLLFGLLYAAVYRVLRAKLFAVLFPLGVLSVRLPHRLLAVRTGWLLSDCKLQLLCPDVLLPDDVLSH